MRFGKCFTVVLRRVEQVLEVFPLVVTLFQIIHSLLLRKCRLVLQLVLLAHHFVLISNVRYHIQSFSLFPLIDDMTATDIHTRIRNLVRIVAVNQHYRPIRGCRLGFSFSYVKSALWSIDSGIRWILFGLGSIDPSPLILGLHCRMTPDLVKLIAFPWPFLLLLVIFRIYETGFLIRVFLLTAGQRFVGRIVWLTALVTLIGRWVLVSGKFIVFVIQSALRHYGAP